MYDKAVTGLGPTVGIGTLAYTGVDLIWLALAGFALVAAGMAILRTVPRRQA
jgi:hypothetical protein